MLSSIRNFFLALIISLALFGVLAYFLIDFIDTSAQGYGIKETTEPIDENNDLMPEEDEYLDTSEFTVVIIGIDSGSSQKSEKPEAALLRGITGSGKTSVYLHLIDQVIKDGKTAIVLAPEIALTPQLMGNFTARFGDRVAVLHSALGLGERYDEWKRIRSGAVSVVVGRVRDPAAR